mmetsp:Transcript_41261/g.80646  ORF Transcript_41261/g.80646 Transcript_41261/m.80646 type:complete len:84 (+) Transcript_41261:25-276(+)
MENKKIEKTYIPRKCSFSNQILTSKDHSSIQISIGILNNNNLFFGKIKTLTISGKIRKKGLSDHALNLLVEEYDSVKTLIKKK